MLKYCQFTSESYVKEPFSSKEAERLTEEEMLEIITSEPQL